MIEFSIDRCTDPIELAARTGSAIIDARAWLLRQQEICGTRAVWSDRSPGDIRSIGASTWPSFRLDLSVSSRYFGFARVDGALCLYAQAECKPGPSGHRERMIGDPLAWFAFIPWQISLVRLREGVGMRLVCPEFTLRHIRMNEWSMTLRLHSDLLPLVVQTKAAITLRCDGHYIKGWDPEIVVPRKQGAL